MSRRRARRILPSAPPTDGLRWTGRVRVAGDDAVDGSALLSQWPVGDAPLVGDDDAGGAVTVTQAPP